MELYSIRKSTRTIESPYPGLYAGVRFLRRLCKPGCERLASVPPKDIFQFHFWRDATKLGFHICKICGPVKLVEEERDLRRLLRKEKKDRKKKG